ncbi:MAG: hypothetical protein N2109_04910 [Fimbriimonadales bacterium]|nr:hypothetical protein [Fimbriimonadales bacterium]
MSTFAVVLEEFASCMVGEEREVDPLHDSYESALRRCRELVDESLMRLAPTAASAEDLFERFLAAGPEPFIDPPGEEPFVARRYAWERCRRMLGPTKR